MNDPRSAVDRIPWRRPRRSLAVVAALVAAIACGCSAKFDFPGLPQEGMVRSPEVEVDAATGVRSIELSVLIYNIAGLPWPLGCGKTSRSLDAEGERIPIDCDRSDAVRDIGDALGELRKQGRAPDIVMLQEAFIAAAQEIPERGGYPNWIGGPNADNLGPLYSSRAPSGFIADRSFWKGERIGKWESSGLILASDYPIVSAYRHPFNRWECAGFDCLANKGLLVAEIEIPGLPHRLAISTTHYNSRGASGVTTERARIAHHLQVDEANEFLEEVGDETLPFIWGGDLNMRRDAERLEYFFERSNAEIQEVSSFCQANPQQCEVLITWSTDAPWFETQDLQGWVSGQQIAITPIRMEMIFDTPVDGVMRSDHNGLWVDYRLSWPVPRPSSTPLPDASSPP
jgi:endonuclease/exonuclease/phosphatase family metal-dependent hydrolase